MKLEYKKLMSDRIGDAAVGEKIRNRHGDEFIRLADTFRNLPDKIPLMRVDNHNLIAAYPEEACTRNRVVSGPVELGKLVPGHVFTCERFPDMIYIVTGTSDAKRVPIMRLFVDGAESVCPTYEAPSVLVRPLDVTLVVNNA